MVYHVLYSKWYRRLFDCKPYYIILHFVIVIYYYNVVLNINNYSIGTWLVWIRRRRIRLCGERVNEKQNLQKSLKKKKKKHAVKNGGQTKGRRMTKLNTTTIEIISNLQIG